MKSNIFLAAVLSCLLVGCSGRSVESPPMDYSHKALTDFMRDFYALNKNEYRGEIKLTVVHGRLVEFSVRGYHNLVMPNSINNISSLESVSIIECSELQLDSLASKYIKDFYVYKCGLKIIPFCVFRRMPQLERIGLRGNGFKGELLLDNLPEKVEIIDVSFNEIDRIKIRGKKSSKLRLIDATGTNLVQLDSSLCMGSSEMIIYMYDLDSIRKRSIIEQKNQPYFKGKVDVVF